jgi:NAD-dependent dihydropyrimidine dehydrogenase PreA subunit
MIRLPNPKSDIQEYIKIISVVNAYVELNDSPTFNFDDISKSLTSIGNISSQKAFGSKAMEASFREDKSLDAVFNQSKALSEVLRLLGLIVSDNNQHTFRITKFGRFVASYSATPRDDFKNQILKLIAYSFLNINYKHPQIIANDSLTVKPFLATLRILSLIENFITKDEFNFFILSLENDNDITLKNTASEILSARNTKNLFEAKKKKALGNISENTASNYTRIPMAFFKSFELIEKKYLKDIPELSSYLTDPNKYINGIKPSKATEIYIIGNSGKISLANFSSALNIKFKEYELVEKEKRIYSAIKSLTDYFSVTETVQDYFETAFPKIKNEKKYYFAFPYQIILASEVEEFENHIDKINSKFNLTLLQPLSSKNETIEFYSWAEKSVNISASLNTFPSTNPKVKFDCVNCRPARCYEYSEEELKCSDKTLQEIPDKNPEQVCALGAIGFNDKLFPELDYNKCVDCGICISRCNYGAITYEADKLIISQKLSKKNLITHSATELDTIKHFQNFEIELDYFLDNELLLKTLTKFFNKVQKLKKDEFYPLVRNLLRTLGVKAKIGKSGDTQWRYDAIVVEPFVMPAEIKSPTEDTVINPNSIRQAIENSITVEASHRLVRKGMSAVVALMYSNKRSASEDMLKDANDLHNIRILLISVVVIVYLNLKNLQNKFTIKDIEYVFKNTIGSFDDKAIKEFWINYLARREELLALDEKAEYFDVKELLQNQNFKFQEKLKEEVEFFEKVFDLIKAKK